MDYAQILVVNNTVRGWWQYNSVSHVHVFFSPCKADAMVISDLHVK